jgi:hypothetical protein
MAKILTNDLWRALQTWTTNKIKGLWDEREARYAGAVYLTQAEYDALSEEQKMDASKVYFIEEE